MSRQRPPKSVGTATSPRAARRSARGLTLALTFGSLALAAVVFVGWQRHRAPAPQPSAATAAGPGSPPAQAKPADGPVFEDFVGAEACARCHEKEYAQWKGSTHGQAGGRTDEVTVLARFDGQPLRFRDAMVTPVRAGSGDYLFHIDRVNEPRFTLKVDAVVGGGHMHGGGTQSFFSRHADGTYRFLPFDFIRRENLWFVQRRDNLTWVPISDQLSLDEDLANWPPRRVLGTASEFSNCQNCHGSQITLQHDDTAHRYQTRFQTLRINCESCHGPGRLHVERVSRPGWEKNPDLGLRALATLNPHDSLATCHQCHASKDALRDDPYLPGARLEDYFSLKLAALTENPFLPDGRIRRFSYQSNHEYSDCYLNGSMTCTDCHDPHSQGYRDVFGRPLPGRFDNRQCTGCHASKGLAPEAHSHHKPDSAGNLCVGCHMPYLQHQGVGQHLTFARSDHSIPIPRPAFDQALGIENACQKCHRDKDLAWQQKQVESWYGRLKPHPPLVTALLNTNTSGSLRDAARAYLQPDARHPMAQAAGLARFIEEQVRPGLPAPDPDTSQRLQAFLDQPDADLRAIALAALHVGFTPQHAPAATIASDWLRKTEESDTVRRRWALAEDHLGSKFAARGDLPAAQACFEKAVEVQPHNEVILSHLALAQFRSGQPDAARTTLQRAIEARPTKAVLHFQLAQVCAQTGQTREAIAALEAGLRHAPNDEAALGLLRQLQAARP